MGFVASESCGSFERSCQSIPVGQPPPPCLSALLLPLLPLHTHTHTHAGSWLYISGSRRLCCHSLKPTHSRDAGKMPASQTGFGNFFLERNISMPTGYQIPMLGSVQQQQAQQLAAMAAGIPLGYSGLQGYNFIPYPHHRHIAHMVS